MKIYLIGGAVRDKLLHLPATDKDWVVIGATPKELLAQGFQQVGHDFPVFLHPQTKEEYALARTERKSGKGYTGFICDFSPEITLEEDLLRRDLTINAIAQTPEGIIIDPYHGIDDLHKRLLRHISPAFQEDPLRVLRVARFAARFAHLGFNIAPETNALMKKMVIKGEINTLTPERVWQETEKALQTKTPEIYFSILNQCGALSILFPEMMFHFANQGILPFAALQQSKPLTQEPLIRFMTLFHASSPCDNGLTSDAINRLCTRIKIPPKYSKMAILILEQYPTIINIATLSPEEILRFLNNIDIWRRPDRLEPLLISAKAILKSQTATDHFPQADLIYYLYQTVSQIDTKNIIADGYSNGAIIKKELGIRRTQVIAHALYDYSSRNK